MDTRTIFKSLNKYNCFIGVYPRDKLPKIDKIPSALIVNTDTSDKPGEHWIAIFVSEKETIYFDSFGLPPYHEDILNFLQNTPGEISFNTVTLQSASADTCGQYCVLFVKMKCRGYTYEDLLAIFTRNTFVNDYMVKHLAKTPVNYKRG